MTTRHHAVRVPATTANLGPGFDSFGAALGLHLYARTLDPGPDMPRVINGGEGAHELPTGDDNLVWRAFVSGCDRAGAPVPNVALRVVTEIPLERGLGSSSAAIVAGLALARARTGLPMGDLDLARAAGELEGHPDNVVPAILGGLTASVGDGDGPLVVRRLTPSPRLRPVWFVPPERQSTEAARAVLPETLPREAAAGQAARAAHVLGALAGLWPAAPRATTDQLHEPARLEVMPAAGELVHRLRGAGVHAWLSGAGPTVVAVVPRSDSRSPERLEALAADARVTVSAGEWDLAGLVVCPDGGCGLSGATGCVQCPGRRV